MKVLLTGADGFLGSNITRELLLQGYEVKAFHTLHRQTITLEGLPITRYMGDLLNKNDLESAIEGCDMIIHAAASTSVWPTRNAGSWKINVEGTQRIIDVALEYKIQKVVYVGTANSFGFGSKENPGDETKLYSCRIGLNRTDFCRFRFCFPVRVIVLFASTCISCHWN